MTVFWQLSAQHQCGNAPELSIEAVSGQQIGFSGQVGQIDDAFSGAENQGYFLPIQCPGDADETGIVIGLLGENGTLGEDREALSQLQQAAVPGQHNFILPCLVPKHTTAAIRVLCAGHAHFVAVVDHGHTGGQQLDGGGQFMAVFIFTAKVADAGRVVAADEIPQEGIGGRMDIALLEAQGAQQGRGGAAASDIVQQTAVEGVVHDTVPLVTLEEIRGVVPNFTYDQGFREFGFHCLAEITPKNGGKFRPLHPAASRPHRCDAASAAPHW